MLHERETHEQSESVEGDGLEFQTGIVVDPSNPTTREIVEEIENSGRIPFSRFMEISLYGQNGYYSSGKVEIANEGGDFTTTPERSDIFGAGLAKELQKVWAALGKPEKFDLVEMGAGTGAMAKQILDWSKIYYPDFYESINYCILEYGTGLIPRQQSSLTNHQVNWVNGNAYQIPFSRVRGAFISNELPDAFPVECIGRINGKLKQRYVTVKNGQWVEQWDDVQEDILNYIKELDIQIDELCEVAINHHAAELQSQLDNALEEGVIITFDYGNMGTDHSPHISATRQGGKGYAIQKSTISTLAALEDPNLADKLKDMSSQEHHTLVIYQNPGNFDITSDVDFSALEQVAADDGLDTSFLGKQGDFFREVGIGEIVRKMKDLPWSQLLTEAECLERYGDHNPLQGMERFENFICLMVTKSQDGLLAEDLAWPEPLDHTGVDAEDLGYGYLFSVWEPGSSNAMAMVKFNNGHFPNPPKLPLQDQALRDRLYKEGAIEHITLRDKDDEKDLKNGKIRTFPDKLVDVVIYNDKGEPVWDLRDKEQLRKFVEGSGYKFDG